MNELLVRLAGGDLRSDGDADWVADDVLRNPGQLPKLLEGLEVSDDVVRGRTAHALERVSRSRPELLYPHLAQLIDAACEDAVPMVRWHVAMIFANLAMFKESVDVIIKALLNLLGDESAFVKSWSISSLTIYGKLYPERCDGILDRVVPLQGDASAAVRNRAFKAIRALEADSNKIPPGWVKSSRLRDVPG